MELIDPAFEETMLLTSETNVRSTRSSTLNEFK